MFYALFQFENKRLTSCVTTLIINVCQQTSGSGALVVAAMLDFLTFALCVPYSETTDGKQFDQLLEMVANKGRILFKLFEVCGRTLFLGIAASWDDHHYSYAIQRTPI